MEREAEELRRAAGERRGRDQGESGKEITQAGPGESRQAPQPFDPEHADWLNKQLSHSLKDLETLQQSLEVDTSFSRRLENINRNLQGVVRNFIGGDPNRLTEIEAQVLNPLRTLEAELAQKLELLQNKEKLFLARDENVPAEYEELVKKYYESLSKTK
jgi:hypothetical protein